MIRFLTTEGVKISASIGLTKRCIIEGSTPKACEINDESLSETVRTDNNEGCLYTFRAKEGKILRRSPKVYPAF